MKHLSRIFVLSMLCLVVGGGFFVQKNYCAFNLLGVLQQEAGGYITTDGMYTVGGGNIDKFALTAYSKLRNEGVYEVSEYNAWKARHGGQSAILYYNGAANVISGTNQGLANLQAGGYGDSTNAQYLQNGLAYQQALAAQQAVPSVPAPAVPAVPASPQAFTSNPEANAQILALQQQYMLATATGDVALQAQCLQLIQVLMAQNS